MLEAPKLREFISQVQRFLMTLGESFPRLDPSQENF